VLSLKKCREILGKEFKLSDEELEKLRAQLYRLGGIAIQMAVGPKRGPSPEKPFDPLSLPKDVLRPTGRRRRRRAGREIHCGRRG